MDDDYKLSEDDKLDIIEFFDAYRLPKLPQGTAKEDLPVATSSLETLLSDMGFLLTECELIEMEEKLDPMKKGYILVTHFIEEAKSLFGRTKLTEKNVDQVYGIFDTDSDGIFKDSDIKAVLSLFGEKLPGFYIKEMILEADMDGDMAISLDEFKFFVAGEIF